jgi:hypothetical protein
LFQQRFEILVRLGEGDLEIDSELRHQVLGSQLPARHFVESRGECLDLGAIHGESGGCAVPSEAGQQIAAVGEAGV